MTIVGAAESDDAPASGAPATADPRRLPGRSTWVEQIMGMAVSVHVRGVDAASARTELATRALFADLRTADLMFSTYRADSEILRMQRGELALADSSAAVREVHRLCELARVRTDGYVDAWALPGSAGLFDPTVLVKTWAVARAARHFDVLPALTVAVGAGGDLLLRSGDLPQPWQIGIEDPRDRARTLATVPVHDGGVATSGLAARGAHIVNPHTGRAALEVVSATVIGPSLMWADVWATAIVARGAAAIDWVGALHGTSGLIVLADGAVHRWQNDA